MTNAAWQNKISQINLDKSENELGKTLPVAHSRSGLAVLIGAHLRWELVTDSDLVAKLSP
jgi:hypothetical protein